ncbi:MAG: polyhydroxybutyrate depolymerase [Halioglobus sp.]|jgi:polyhydroxybutyrate depolymerase
MWMFRRVGALLLCALTFSILQGHTTFAQARGSDTLCETEAGILGKTVAMEMVHDGESRKFHLHLPSAYDCLTPLPLVIGVHGYGGNGPDFEKNTATMFEHVNENNYIALYPTAMSASPGGATSFNDLGSRHDSGPDGKTCSRPSTGYYPSFDNCGAAEEKRECNWGTSCADDLGFFKKLIAFAKNNYAVDSSRIYMLGFSQGGQTVSTLACPLQNEVTAVAAIHGLAANGYTCGPQSKVSLLQIWGTRDEWVRADGRPSEDAVQYDAADEAAQEWASAQHCDNEAKQYGASEGKTSGWSCESHSACQTGAEVVTCSWPGGHVWPRSQELGNFGLNTIWEFFSDKTK